MPDLVKRSTRSEDLEPDKVPPAFRRLVDMCLEHRGAWNRFVEGFAGIIALSAFPVGTIYTTVSSTFDPNITFGGTWVAFGSGRVLVGRDAGQTEFDTIEETGGAKTHTLLTAEMPSHTHVQDSHNHTQDAHTHTQNSHNHTQDAHNHGLLGGLTDDTGAPFPGVDASSSTAAAVDGVQDTTATNQAATATNQNATATNQAATATNQSTGGDGAHNNLQPYIVVYFFKRTA